MCDLDTGQAEATLAGHMGDSPVAVTPDGRRVVSGSWDGALSAWDVGSGP